MNKKTQRFWEIDTLRGIAVILMITYHILFDLDFLNILSLPLHNLFFRLFLYPIGTLFLLVVGISLVLSYKRYIQKQNQTPSFSKYLKRGGFLFFIALFITVLTWIYPHEGFIVFGIIHCIGISIILSYLFISKPNISLVFGFIFVILGIYFALITILNPYFFWIGLKTPSFYTLDYFPLLPWFGVVLIGLFVGQKIYPTLQSKYGKQQHTPTVFRPISFIGRYSLVIYLLHQPILFGVLFILFR